MNRPAARQLRLCAVLISALIVIAAIIILAGCRGFRTYYPANYSNSGNPVVLKDLVVPDAGNHRVLIYKAPFTTAQAAAIVLGQPDFTSNTCGTAANRMCGPQAVARDNAGNLYVVENEKGDGTGGPIGTGNQRVVRYPADANTANLVLGTSDLNTKGSIAGAGIALDQNGNIFVSDYRSGKILKFNASGLTSGAEPSVTTSTPALQSPVGLAFDPSGNLWVAESSTNRVVQITAFGENMTTGIVIGQQPPPPGDFDVIALSGATLSTPSGIAFDSAGNLWVADKGNNRVLRFSTPLSNGKAADLVIGQPDFTSYLPNGGVGGPTSSSLNGPEGVTFVNGKLIVGDTENNRTLIFGAPFSTGMAAEAVLGQPDFLSSSVNQGGAASAKTQARPYGGGPSWIALAVFAALVGAWFFYSRRRKAAAQRNA